jgi:RNA polymerase sigma-70 factor (ECF subfamily)
MISAPVCSEDRQPMNDQDAEKLARLWTESQPIVVAYIFSLMPDSHRADDVLQTVAVALLKRFDTYDQTRPFLPWVLGIAKKEVLKSRRALMSDRHLFCDSLAEQLKAAYQDEADSVGTFRLALRQCLSKLGGRILSALRLRYAHDLKTAEVAQRMGATPGAIRVLLHRAHETLRQCIERRLKENAS